MEPWCAALPKLPSDTPETVTKEEGGQSPAELNRVRQYYLLILEYSRRQEVPFLL